MSKRDGATKLSKESGRPSSLTPQASLHPFLKDFCFEEGEEFDEVAVLGAGRSCSRLKSLDFDPWQAVEEVTERQAITR